MWAQANCTRANQLATFLAQRVRMLRRLASQESVLNDPSAQDRFSSHASEQPDGLPVEGKPWDEHLEVIHLKLRRGGGDHERGVAAAGGRPAAPQCLVDRSREVIGRKFLS